MMGREKYILDSDVFISAKNSYYSFNLCPGFWNSLIYFSKKEQICSINKVRDEIQKGNDDLVSWIEKLNNFFYDHNNNVTSPNYKEIIDWITHKSNYTTEAIARFVKGADTWLIAFAKTNNLIVVTNEKSNPESKKKIKIPDICNRYNVQYINTFEMLGNLNVQFKWNEKNDF